MKNELILQLKERVGGEYNLFDCKKALFICEDDLEQAVRYLLARDPRMGKCITYERTSISDLIEEHMKDPIKAAAITRARKRLEERKRLNDQST